MPQPGHLQTSAGYLRIGLDLRIPTVPKNPDFRFRIGRKIRKTEKNRKNVKRHMTPYFKGNCKQVFVVRMIFIGGNGGKEGAWRKGWSKGGGMTHCGPPSLDGCRPCGDGHSIFSHRTAV